MPGDPFALQRFTAAQAPVWDDVTAELRAGRKRTHWMWFVFPQLAALGRSGTAKHYGLSGVEEARAYLEDPVLGPRLLAACELLMALPERSAVPVLGDVDTMKLRSCLTLFAAVAPDVTLFADCLQKFFAGQRDPLTLEWLRARPAGVSPAGPA